MAQVVYLDHCGNGRSEYGDPSTWNLARSGDDVRGFCDALGIHKPVVYGVSFGGFVAQSYATRHPQPPGKLVLASTAALPDRPAVFSAFERIGGAQARLSGRSLLADPDARRAHRLPRAMPPALQHTAGAGNWSTSVPANPRGLDDLGIDGAVGAHARGEVFGRAAGGVDALRGQLVANRR